MSSLKRLLIFIFPFVVGSCFSLLNLLGITNSSLLLLLLICLILLESFDFSHSNEFTVCCNIPMMVFLDFSSSFKKHISFREEDDNDDEEEDDNDDEEEDQL